MDESFRNLGREWREKDWRLKTVKDGQRTMHQEKGQRLELGGESEVAQALRRGRARWELKLKVSWLHTLQCFSFCFSCYTLVPCYNTILCILGILYKITKSIILILLVTYILTCTYREYFWKAKQEIGNSVASRIVNVWDTLEEERLETFHFCTSWIIYIGMYPQFQK